MDLGLDDKTALVTGASRGIGKYVARVLLDEGCSVVVCNRDEEAMAPTAEELAEHGNVYATQADVTSQADVDALVAAADEEFGGVDVLVNNAGIIGSERPLHELDVEEWEQVYDVNVTGAVRTTKAVLPHMREQGWGRIVNVASEAGTQPDSFKPHYDSSKAALVNLTKNLSKAYGEDGVLVNAVSPATTYTPLVQDLFEERAEAEDRPIEEIREEFLREECPNVVLDRLAEPEEVANVVTFLASERASYVTGANYRVDGGSIAAMDA